MTNITKSLQLRANPLNNQEGYIIDHFKSEFVTKQDCYIYFCENLLTYKLQAFNATELNRQHLNGVTGLSQKCQRTGVCMHPDKARIGHGNEYADVNLCNVSRKAGTRVYPWFYLYAIESWTLLRSCNAQEEQIKRLRRMPKSIQELFQCETKLQW